MSTVETSTPTPITTSTPGALLSLTEKAVEKVKYFAGTMPDAAGKPLRIFVQGGGCSGSSTASPSMRRKRAMR